MAPQPIAVQPNRRREEELVNFYEAEEERLTNSLSRKLEQLREEKIQLENTLEAESESQVLKLQRELASLRAFQHDQLDTNASAGPSRGATNGGTSNSIHDPRFPPQDVMLDAMRRENESLRARLADSERDCVRLSRMNDVYRQELIDLRRRLGLPIDNLIGITAPSPSESYSRPTHLRRAADTQVTASTSSLAAQSPEQALSTRPALGLPIPITRAPSSSQAHRQTTNLNSSSTTPLTNNSPSSYSVPNSPFPFSPSTSSHVDRNRNETASSSSSSSLNNGGSSLANGTSSYLTQITTPPSSTSPLLHMHDPTVPFVATLTYPSVPPPSLSSSLGSPAYSRRSSFGQGHAGRRVSLSHERGSVRVAETGSLRATAAAGLPSEVLEESPPGTPPPGEASSPASVVGINAQPN